MTSPPTPHECLSEMAAQCARVDQYRARVFDWVIANGKSSRQSRQIVALLFDGLEVIAEVHSASMAAAKAELTLRLLCDAEPDQHPALH